MNKEETDAVNDVEAQKIDKETEENKFLSFFTKFFKTSGDQSAAKITTSASEDLTVKMSDCQDQDLEKVKVEEGVDLDESKSQDKPDLLEQDNKKVEEALNTSL